MTRAIKARSGAPDRSKRRIDPPTPTSARRSSTTALTRRQLNSDRLLGVLRLFRGIEAVRAEAVSLRAIEIGVLSYASVASIFKHRLDQKASPQAADGTPLLHDNIRGSGYFH